MKSRVYVTAFAVFVLLQAAGPQTVSAAPDLANVRELYASASYEEALEVLASLESADDVEAIEQYRALCLLGLGRTADAERSLERIITRRPLYVVSAADVSPRLVAMFHDVRRRALPAAARQAYAAAKASYDRKEFEAASGNFKDVLAIVHNPDASAHASALGELKQLAEGFLALSEAGIKAAAPPPPSPPAAASPVAVEAKPAAPRVFTAADANVTAPVAIVRSMPKWTPPNNLVAQQTFRGVVEVIVNEQGLVEWSGISRPTFASYDGELLAMTKQWQFRPATRDGQAVKYRLGLEVVLLASREE